MDETAAIFEGVGFGDSKTGAGDRFFDIETFSKAASESGFAGSNITDEFDNDWLDGS